MSLRSHLTLAAALVAAGLSLNSYASPISGTFSFRNDGGTYMSGSSSTGTAQTATGLDFGTTTSTGNGYGTNGIATITIPTGSFAGLTSASIADIALGATANPYTSNPFIAFTGSNIVLNFSNATITRSPTGTSVTVAGAATFTDGIAADASTGTFSLSVNSQAGDPNNFNFTFTGNAGTAVAVTPEPSSLALLGTGLIGAAGIALRRRKLTA